MAVKVMWARAVRPQVEAVKPSAVASPRLAPDERAARPAASAKPKRRRSSVYDADGNEVFITLLCLKCHKTRPLSQFGLRRMADGAIRNQPWCRACRSDASPRKKDPAISEEPSVSGGPSAEAVAAPSTPRDAGLLAAEVAAALHRGRG